MKTFKPIKNFVVFLLVLISITPLSFAEDESAAETWFSTSELDELLAPIALYPDPLLAQILPASTYPLEIVQAARLIQSETDADKIDSQDWDASVKAVAHYPTVLKMMNDDLNWTQKLGQAVLNQQDDVLKTVQNLRQQAKTAGNLRSSEKQIVAESDNLIQIVPATPEVIYVPVYDPRVVYVVPFDVFPAPRIRFFGFRIGRWLNIGFFWPERRIFYCEPDYWHGGWHHIHNVHVDNTHITNIYNITNVNNTNVNVYQKNTWVHDTHRGSPYHGGIAHPPAQARPISAIAHNAAPQERPSPSRNPDSVLTTHKTSSGTGHPERQGPKTNQNHPLQTQPKLSNHAPKVVTPKVAPKQSGVAKLQENNLKNFKLGLDRVSERPKASEQTQSQKPQSLASQSRLSAASHSGDNSSKSESSHKASIKPDLASTRDEPKIRTENQSRTETHDRPNLFSKPSLGSSQERSGRMISKAPVRSEPRISESKSHSRSTTRSPAPGQNRIRK